MWIDENTGRQAWTDPIDPDTKAPGPLLSQIAGGGGGGGKPAVTQQPPAVQPPAVPAKAGSRAGRTRTDTGASNTEQRLLSIRLRR